MKIITKYFIFDITFLFVRFWGNLIISFFKTLVDFWNLLGNSDFYIKTILERLKQMITQKLNMVDEWNETIKCFYFHWKWNSRIFHYILFLYFIICFIFFKNFLNLLIPTMSSFDYNQPWMVYLIVEQNLQIHFHMIDHSQYLLHMQHKCFFYT